LWQRRVVLRAGGLRDGRAASDANAGSVQERALGTDALAAARAAPPEVKLPSPDPVQAGPSLAIDCDFGVDQ